MGDDTADDPVGVAARDDAGEPVTEGGPEQPAVGERPAPLDQRARAAEDRLAEVLAAYRRLRAENESFRTRVARGIERQYERRRERLVLKFIDILDNLDRALEAAERSYAGNPLIEGLILVRTQLLQVLQQEGLERVPVLGLPYDPAVSEAVATQPVGDKDRHHLVVAEMLRGYRLHGRVVRPSHVVVGAYQESATEPVAESSELIGADEVRERAAAEATAAEPASDPLASRLFDQADIDEMLGNGTLKRD